MQSRGGDLIAENRIDSFPVGVLDQSHVGPMVARLRILINGRGLSTDPSQDTCRREGLRLSIILVSGRTRGGRVILAGDCLARDGGKARVASPLPLIRRIVR